MARSPSKPARARGAARAGDAPLRPAKGKAGASRAAAGPTEIVAARRSPKAAAGAGRSTSKVAAGAGRSTSKVAAGAGRSAPEITAGARAGAPKIVVERKARKPSSKGASASTTRRKPTGPRRLAEEEPARAAGPAALATWRSAAERIAATVTPGLARAALALERDRGGATPVALPVPIPPPLARSPRMEASPADSAAAAAAMQLHWGDMESPDPGAGGEGCALLARWTARGAELVRELAAHGVGAGEYRADLRERRFVWLSPEGTVDAEATARVLCGWSRSTSVVLMAWADPLVRAASVPRLEGVPAERDDLDEDGAWRVAAESAELSSATYVCRVPSPHGSYFLALGPLSFGSGEAWDAGSPAALVLQSLGEARTAIESRAEPSRVVRDRLDGAGRALLRDADHAYRGTDWVARLARTGKRLLELARRLPSESFGGVAAGRPAGEWLDREATLDLSHALGLLEDEWAIFA